jgi:hypothetical protein
VPIRGGNKCSLCINHAWNGKESNIWNQYPWNFTHDYFTSPRFGERNNAGEGLNVLQIVLYFDSS